MQRDGRYIKKMGCHDSIQYPERKAKQRALDDSRINSVNEITGPIIPIHRSLYEFSADRHDYENCEICSKDDKGCLDILWGVQQALDNETIILRYPEPKEFVPNYHGPLEEDVEFEEKSIDYQRSQSNPDPDHSVNVIVPCFKEVGHQSNSKIVRATFHLSDNIPFPSQSTISNKPQGCPIQPVENIVGTSRVTRSGRIFAPIINQKPKSDNMKKIVSPPKASSNEVEPLREEEDEVMRIIKRSEYKVVDQLLQTPSKISILSLLLNSETHRNSLMKILDQAYVEQDVTTK